MLRFADQFIAHFHFNWLAPVKIRRALIAGSQDPQLHPMAPAGGDQIANPWRKAWPQHEQAERLCLMLAAQRQQVTTGLQAGRGRKGSPVRHGLQ